MNIEQLLKRIEINPDVLAGKPIIRGYRISVEQIIMALGSGLSEENILKEFPELEVDDLRACLLYAGKMMESEKVYKVAWSAL